MMNYDSNIMQKSHFAQTEHQVIEEARHLRAKLLDIKKKKEQQNNQAVRTELSAIYTKIFEQFKLKLQTQCQDQITSLELAKQLRVTEITDVENRLKQLLTKLQSQQLHLKQKLQDLNSSHQDALNFLREEQSGQLEQLRLEKESQLLMRVQGYRQSIDIE